MQTAGCCTALTGVEAVSNGVKAFREPAVKNAQRTLTVIIFLLAVLLAGISYLVKVYGIAATDPGSAARHANEHYPACAGRGARTRHRSFDIPDSLVRVPEKAGGI